mgnify:CR=1 FL=1
MDQKPLPFRLHHKALATTIAAGLVNLLHREAPIKPGPECDRLIRGMAAAEINQKFRIQPFRTRRSRQTIKSSTHPGFRRTHPFDRNQTKPNSSRNDRNLYHHLLSLSCNQARSRDHHFVKPRIQNRTLQLELKATVSVFTSFSDGDLISASVQPCTCTYDALLFLCFVYIKATTAVQTRTYSIFSLNLTNLSSARPAQLS